MILYFKHTPQRVNFKEIDGRHETCVNDMKPPITETHLKLQFTTLYTVNEWIRRFPPHLTLLDDKL